MIVYFLYLHLQLRYLEKHAYLHTAAQMEKPFEIHKSIWFQ